MNENDFALSTYASYLSYAGENTQIWRIEKVQE